MEENNYTAYQQPLTPEEAPPVKPKKKGKKALLIVIAVVVVIAIAAAIILPSLKSSPMAVLVKGAENTKAVLEQTELHQMRLRNKDGAAMEASLDLAPITQSIIGFPLDGRVLVKLYAAEGFWGLGAAAELGGTPLLDAAAQLTREDLIVASQSILGDQAYGVDLTKLEENFDSSVFGPDGEYSLGISAADLRLIVDALQPDEQNEQLNKELEAVLTDLALAIYQSLQTHGTVTENDSSLTFGGKNHPTTAVTIAMDAPAMVEFAADILEHVNTDRKLRELITTHSHTILSSLSFADMTEEELVNEFYSAVEEALLSLDEAREEAADSDLYGSLTLHVTKAGSYLVGAEIALTNEGETLLSEFVLGIEDGKITERRIVVDTFDGPSSLSYLITENSDSRYTASLTVTAYGETVIESAVRWDKATGDLAVEVDYEGDKYLFDCAFSHDETRTVFTLRSIEDVSYGSKETVGLTLTLTPGDKMAPMGAYTDVLTMSPDEVDAVVSQLYMTFMQLLGILG